MMLILKFYVPNKILKFFFMVKDINNKFNFGLQVYI